MGDGLDQECGVCLSPLRYNVEQAYLEGARLPVAFTRQQVERHMAHLTDPQSLATIKGLGGTAALASRLRQLEVAATAILDAALAQRDGLLAVRALREARQTIVELSRLGRELAGGAGGQDVRSDLDDAIAAYVGGQLRDPVPTGAGAPPVPLAIEGGGGEEGEPSTKATE